MTTTLMPFSPETTDLSQSLLEMYGFREFRPLQEQAVRAALEGRDVLVVMPTGAGKSLCFQLPAALSEGVTIVVSPLIALMNDQVDALEQRPAFRELGVACLTSGQSLDEQRERLMRLRQGRLRLVYVAPERFRSSAFLDALRAAKIARFVVDEAHCISEWGHDFRPDYLTLKTVVDDLGRPPLLAVTATATRRVQQSIIANLGMRDPEVVVGGFNRANLHFAVHRCKSERDRLDRLARALPKLSALGGSGLIYVATRKQCEEVVEIADAALSKVGQRAGMYHAGLDSDLRNQMQREWLAGQRQVLVATNAFGMGIDKADVRFVVHCACPDSLESYYQEAGRAGRDGRKSRVVILYHFSDRRTREWFIDNEALTVDALQAAFGKMRAALAHNREDMGEADDVVRLPRLWGMQAAGWGETTARLALGELERAGLVQRAGQSGDDLSLRLLRADFPPDAARRIREDLARQRAERFRRLDEITDYCKTVECRRRTILDYFGDRQEPPPGPFCCDNCDAPKPEAAPASLLPRIAMPVDIDGRDIYSILQGLDALRPALGKSRLNKLLRATGTRETPGFNPAKSSLHGLLRGCTRSQVDGFLDSLVTAGLMNRGDEDAYFVYTITSKGRRAWQEKVPLSIPVPADPSEWSRDDSADSDVLLDRLKAWRRDEASRAGLPSYCIFGDRTLMEIARHKPQSLDDLLSVNGVGKSKLEKYGRAVLNITGE